MDYPAMAISQIGLAHIFALLSITKILCESTALRVTRYGLRVASCVLLVTCHFEARTQNL